MSKISKNKSNSKTNTCKELVLVESKTKIIREPKTDGYFLDLCKNGLTVFPDSYLDNYRLGVRLFNIIFTLLIPVLLTFLLEIQSK